MKKYQVCVRRLIRQSASIYVAAESEKEAVSIALEISRETEPDWFYADEYQRDAAVVGAE